MKREMIEWCQFYWYDTPNAALPRVLLMGDSIVVGYRDRVAGLLKGKATIGAFSTSKIVGDPAIYRELELALADYPIDVIYFNNGLHGLDCDDDFYRQGLVELVEFLRINTRAQLIWRNSTPITVAKDPSKWDERNEIVLRRNRIAAEIMTGYGIPMDDLYSLVCDHPEWSAGDGFHYNDAGREAEAQHVAAYLEKYVHESIETISVNGFETDYPGRMSIWEGFRRYDFHVNGVRCILVSPNGAAAPGKPWFWRARFFGAFPYVDKALLKLGWHVAHIEVDELYGSPESNRRFDLLYAFLTSLGFKSKCVPVGYSRGGLDVYNWARRNPEKVSCLYLDNPVCDFKSWPGGKGVGPGSVAGWENCLKAYGFTEEQALAWPGNPVDNLTELAEAGIPILHLCADADEVVPPQENTALIEKRYPALGGDLTVIHKPGAKHHPHCLDNPQPIVDFVLKHNR